MSDFWRMGMSTRGNLEEVHKALPLDDGFFPKKVKVAEVQVSTFSADLADFTLADYLP
jgi:hypothetical protein